MYQDFGKTPYGFIRIDTQAIVSLVSRHLPSGALCTAVRLTIKKMPERSRIGVTDFAVFGAKETLS